MSRPVGTPGVEQIRELPALLSQKISADWEDINGHINVGYYMSVYNESGWPMMEQIGIDRRYFEERHLGLVDLDNHLRYASELHVGEQVSAHGRFLSYDNKRIHGVLYVVNDDKNRLACSIEFLSINFDLKLRRSTVIPDDIAAHLAAISAKHSQLAWAPETCKSLVTKARS